METLDPQQNKIPRFGSATKKDTPIWIRKKKFADLNPQQKKDSPIWIRNKK
jgi:hypothetical protein